MWKVWIGLVLVGVLAVWMAHRIAQPAPEDLPALSDEEFADLCREVGKSTDTYAPPGRPVVNGDGPGEDIGVDGVRRQRDADPLPARP